MFIYFTSVLASVPVGSLNLDIQTINKWINKQYITVSAMIAIDNVYSKDKV